MNFKDVVNLSQLVTGDRFYFLGNKAKAVQVLLDINSKPRASGYTNTALVLEGIWLDKRAAASRTGAKLDTSKYIKTFEKAEDIKVVFLRHEVAIC